MNKKNLLIAFCAAILVLSAGVAKADVLTADAGWTVTDTFGNENGTWYGAYTISSPGAVTVTITDLYVASDNYSVYLNGGLVTTTSVASDFSFDSNPDSALASSSFAHVIFGAGNGDLVEIFATPP